MQGIGIRTSDSLSPPRRWRFWLLRTLAAIAFAFASTAVVEAFWIGLLVAVYGSLDTALKEMRPSASTSGGSAAFFASALAGFLGAFIAPLVLGSCTESRRAVALSSVVGAVVAVVPAVMLATLAGSLSWVIAPGTMIFAWVGLALGVLTGVAGGVIGGLMLRGSIRSRNVLGAGLVLVLITIALVVPLAQWQDGTTQGRPDRDRQVKHDDGGGRLTHLPDVAIDAPLKDRFSELKEGMTLAEVEAVLGPAGLSYSSDTSYEYYIWKGNDGWCRVWVRGGQVFKLGFDNPKDQLEQRNKDAGK